MFWNLIMIVAKLEIICNRIEVPKTIVPKRLVYRVSANTVNSLRPYSEISEEKIAYIQIF